MSNIIVEGEKFDPALPQGETPEDIISAKLTQIITQRRYSKRFLAKALVATTLTPLLGHAMSPKTNADSSGGTCSFQLGFKTLHDLIPGIVGDCLVDEHHNPINGDGLQETTGPVGGSGTGLLVWRKADNWTAYTDGYRTWINGPYGLQSRLNTDRFPWEVAQTKTVEAKDPIGSLDQGLRIDIENTQFGNTIIKVVPRSSDLETNFFSFIANRIKQNPSQNIPTWVHIVDITNPVFASNPNVGWLDGAEANSGLRTFNVRDFAKVQDGLTFREIWITFSEGMFTPVGLQKLTNIGGPNYYTTQILPIMNAIFMSGLAGSLYPAADDIKSWMYQYPFTLQWAPASNPSAVQTIQ